MCCDRALYGWTASGGHEPAPDQDDGPREDGDPGRLRRCHRVVLGTGMGPRLVAPLRRKGITEFVVPAASLAVFLVPAAALGLIAATPHRGESRRARPNGGPVASRYRGVNGLAELYEQSGPTGSESLRRPALSGWADRRSKQRPGQNGCGCPHLPVRPNADGCRVLTVSTGQPSKYPSNQRDHQQGLRRWCRCRDLAQGRLMSGLTRATGRSRSSSLR
jgi:hypothetical protein